MKSSESQSNGKSFKQVFNRKGERIRGLWLRGDVYYAQVWLHDSAKQIPLNGAKTVPEAQTARQELKAKIKRGEYPPKGEQQQVATAENRDIAAAIAGYQKTRGVTAKLDSKTHDREDSGLNAWARFCEEKKITDLSAIDLPLCLDFVEWRREEKPLIIAARAKAQAEGKVFKMDPKMAEEALSGRTLDLNVQAIEKVLDWAYSRKWLKTKPDIDWESLADDPKDLRLLTAEELDQLCAANLVTEKSLEVLPEAVRRLRRLQAPRAVLFSDYLKLIFLSGPREHETLLLKWPDIHWSNAERGHIFFAGENAKAGGGKKAKDRNVDFHTKLEAHLLDMYSRRNPDSEWLFPSFYDPAQPMKSFRKQLLSARETCYKNTVEKLLKKKKTREVAEKEASFWLEIAFHHGRHYFISWAVSAEVDFQTIATWVSHRNIYLIMRRYSHLVPGQTKRAAAKLDSVF